MLYKVALCAKCCEHVCVLRLLWYRYMMIYVFMGGQCDISHLICDDWIRIMTSRFVVVVRVESWLRG